eukprot:TRINITY_DN69928_c0_g1_i1.p1 TRINITY_DN69928_c0_g1~~TRINITY_DN69928_c0_g1_i1.p1  ORF type:complete len:812 (-),score=111.49 TRINITY_DN69928_c0_g1_i1:40-2475(-)
MKHRRRPAAVALQRQSAKKVLERQCSTSSVAALRRRPAAMTLVATTSTLPEAVGTVVSERACVKGGIVFTESPLFAAQATRSSGEHHAEQPLFCAEAACCKPAGPLEAALALAAGRLCRAELMEFAQCNDGDALGLLNWLDFASKTSKLPSPSIDFASRFNLYRGELRAPQRANVASGDEQPMLTTPCFCSADCRTRWMRGGHPAACSGHAIGSNGASARAAVALLAQASTSGHEGLLVMTAEAVTRAALPLSVAPLKDETLYRQHRGIRCVRVELQPILRVVPRGKAGSVASLAIPRRTLVRAHAHVITLHAAIIAALGGCSVRLAREQALAAVPFALYTKVVLALDARAWSLSGATLPSQLGRYCEAMCDPAVSSVLQSEMLRAVSSTVHELRKQQDLLDADSSDEEHGSQQAAENGGQCLEAIQLPSPETARRLQPVRLPKLFSREDISRIKALSDSMCVEEHNKFATASQWRTRYLHAGHAIQRSAPDLLERLREAALAVDSREGGWGLLRGMDASRLRPRVVEHHLVSSGGALPDPTHFDGGSLFSLDLMLSERGGDFEGGDFCTVEHDGSIARHDFSQGDVLVFPSHKPHFVQPVTSGLRQVMVLELWDGEERRCDHRCPLHRGRCIVEESLVVTSAACVDVADGNGFSETVSAGSSVLGRTDVCRPAKRRREESDNDTYSRGFADSQVVRSGVSRNTAFGLSGAQTTLEEVKHDASGAFSSTAFDGIAFFPRVAQIMAQSDVALSQGRKRCNQAMDASPNVEIVFEDAAPRAAVRALRRLRRGEQLIVSTCQEDGFTSETDSDG